MSKILFLAIVCISLSCAAILAAQPNLVRDDFTFPNDIKVGTRLLPAGHYEIASDGVKVTFTRLSDGKKVLEVRSESRKLAMKYDHTEINVAKDSSGAFYIERLYLKGSDIEHMFYE